MRLYSNAYEGKYFINLVDNLSGIYDKESKKCMEEKTIRLNCELDLKMVDWIINAKNSKNHTAS